MFTHRLRGLINLHATFAGLAALVLMGGYAALLPFLPLSRLSIDINLTPYYLCVALGMLVSTSFVQRMAAGYHRLSWPDAAWLTTRQIGVIVLLVFAFMFAFKDRSLSRLFMGTYLGLCWVLLLAVNFALPKMLCRIFFVHSRRVPTLFVGTLRSLEQLKSWLAAKEALGMQPVGFLTFDGNATEETEPPFMGGLPELGRRIETTGAGQVILLEVPRTQTEGRHIIATCQQRGCRLLIHSNLSTVMQHPLVTVTEEGRQFYTLQEEPLEDPINRVLKRVFDIAVSLPVVVVLLPPLGLLVAIMQRWQAPGPLFWSQERTGHGQRPFRMFKFRSMFAADRATTDENRQASRHDRRIYPFGAFLRRTSLDEFPQFLNVLLGHMSIVGPRPHLPAHDDTFARQMSTYRTRFFVKPGITGLAQCNGFRGEITDPQLLQKRVEHDLAYISHWSIWLDVQITFKTAKQVVFPPKSAY